MKLKYRLGALALVAVAIVAFALPDMLVDKDRLRDRLVRSVYEATGRELAIEGGLGLSLLPVPRLSATRVRLSNPPGSAEPWMAEVERVTARLDFWELMLGRISLRDLSLDKPVIRFAAGPDGGGNWNFLRPGELPPRFPRAAVTARPQPGSAAPAAEASPKVRFERLSIVDGRVSYADGKRSWTAEGLFVDVDANDLSGPFLFSGRVTLAGQKVKIRVAAVDIVLRTIDFALADAPEKSASEADGRSERRTGSRSGGQKPQDSARKKNDRGGQKPQNNDTRGQHTGRKRHNGGKGTHEAGGQQ